MGTLDFDKYSATGNYLLVSDVRNIDISFLPETFWANLCAKNDADGIVLIHPSTKADFKMQYRNLDGGEVNLCGNGLRAMTHFLFHKEGTKEINIETNMGVYKTWALSDSKMKIQMVELYDIGVVDLTSFYDFKESIYLNTGVPHCVFITEDVDKVDVNARGKQISKNNRFKKESNVNFVQIIKDNEVKVRTYERGVEKETLSCGSGAMAVAVGMNKLKGWKEKVLIHTRGGDLYTEFDENFDEMFLSGEVEVLSHGSEPFERKESLSSV